MKRVVTGFDDNGTSIFISKGSPQVTYENVGLRWTEIWNSYPEDTLPIDPPAGPIRETVNESVFPDTGKDSQRFFPYLDINPSFLLVLGNISPALFFYS